MRFWFLASLFALPSFAGLPHFNEWFDFDPKNIVVEDPDVVLLAELPRGDLDLKHFRANAEDIALFSKNYHVEEGDKKDNPKAPDCTRAEVAALKLWATNEVYKQVNLIIRTAQKGLVNGLPVHPQQENLILTIASAVNCAPQYEGRVVRGESAPDFIFEQYQEGNYLGQRGFTSTTKGTTLTPYFVQNSKQRIFIDKARGADLDSLGIATWPEEKEVLIRPGTVFRVVTKTKIQHKYLEWDFRFEQF